MRLLLLLLPAASMAATAPGGEPFMEVVKRVNGICALMTLVSYLPYDESTCPSTLTQDQFLAAKEAAQQHFWRHVNPDGSGIRARELRRLFLDTGPDNYGNVVMPFIVANRADQSDKPLSAFRRVKNLIRRRKPMPKGERNEAAETELFNHLNILKEFATEGEDEGDVAFYSVEDEGLDAVVGITVNHAAKRVMVVFRGSQNIVDWIDNMEIGKKKVKLGDRRVGIHRGFWDRLMTRSPKTGKLFFEDIIKPALKTEFEDVHAFADSSDANPRVANHRQYSLYVAGHSLGGALATLAGLLFAVDDDLAEWFPGPVTTVSLAAPRVGDAKFRSLYQDLMEKGRLRHLRVMNPDDPVPRIPPALFFGYHHVGVRALLYPESPTFRNGIEYPDISKFRSNPDPSSLFETLWTNHFTWKYLERAKAAIKENADVLGTTIDDIFLNLPKPK